MENRTSPGRSAVDEPRGIVHIAHVEFRLHEDRHDRQTPYQNAQGRRSTRHHRTLDLGLDNFKRRFAVCRSLLLLLCVVIVVTFTGACDLLIAETSLTSVPKELQFVLDNREAFDPTSHPLRDIVLGEATIDAGEGLDGCWGRLQAETTFEQVCGPEEFLGVPLNCEPGSEVEILVAEVLRINFSDGFVESQSVWGVDGGLAFFEDRAPIQVLTEELLAVGDDRLLRQVVTGRGGLLNGDGSVDSDIRAVLGVEVSIDAKTETAFTLDGDFLATADGNLGMDAASEDLELWFRFDCDNVE